MSFSKTFNRFLAIVFLSAFAYLPLTGYFDARRAESEIDIRSLQQKLAHLEAGNAKIKNKMIKKAKIATILEKFKTRLGYEPEKIAELLMEQSERYSLDPLLIIALIKTESDFRRKAVSKKGAVGLMQVRPFVAIALAKETRVVYKNSKNLKDGALNIKLGTHYFAKLRKRFGSLELALVAYNRGPSRLRRQIGAGKTIRSAYANKVLRHYDRFSSDFSAL
ncbi:MAG: lytic transglycosylase domain-containing protein [Nitrospinota bacterium]